jgi:CDP-diacylglycerol--glycerol-3-phosphate 3-phosphatidyltransferase
MSEPASPTTPREPTNLNPANIVTIARILLIPLFLVVLLTPPPWPAAAVPWWATWAPWVAALVFALLAGTDAVDGYLARSRNQVTTFGKFIDPLADKLLVTAALIGLVQLGELPAWIAILIISREFIVSGLRLVAVAEGKVISASPLGKLKTVAQTVAIVMFIVKGPKLASVIGAQAAVWFGWAAWAVMIVAVALTIWSMIDYFYGARDVLAGPWKRERA